MSNLDHPGTERRRAHRAPRQRVSGPTDERGTADNGARPQHRLPMKVAATIALGLGTFAITAVVVLIAVLSWLLLLILAGHMSGPEIPAALRFSGFIIYNVALAVIVVSLPVWIAVWGARRFGVASAIVTLLIAAVLMGGHGHMVLADTYDGQYVHGRDRVS